MYSEACKAYLQALGLSGSPIVSLNHKKSPSLRNDIGVPSAGTLSLAASSRTSRSVIDMETFELYGAGVIET